MKTAIKAATIAITENDKVVASLVALLVFLVLVLVLYPEVLIFEVPKPPPTALVLTPPPRLLTLELTGAAAAPVPPVILNLPE